MSAYQQLRTKQRERDTMKQATRVTRIDTHRACLMDAEADDAAPEGAWVPVDTPASPWIGAKLGAAAIVAVALLATAALVWP